MQSSHVSRQGHYHLNTIGTLPLNSSDEMNLIVKFDGDMLGLIPKWQPFFLDGAGLPNGKSGEK